MLRAGKAPPTQPSPTSLTSRGSTDSSRLNPSAAVREIAEALGAADADKLLVAGVLGKGNWGTGAGPHGYSHGCVL